MKTFKKVNKDILRNPYESSEVFWTEWHGVNDDFSFCKLYIIMYYISWNLIIYIYLFIKKNWGGGGGVNYLFKFIVMYYCKNNNN